jgi:hypothetical protein
MLFIIWEKSRNKWNSKMRNKSQVQIESINFSNIRIRWWNSKNMSKNVQKIIFNSGGWCLIIILKLKDCKILGLLLPEIRITFGNNLKISLKIIKIASACLLFMVNFYLKLLMKKAIMWSICRKRNLSWRILNNLRK